MDRLLRGLFQVGIQGPEDSECLSNWWKFQSHDFEFSNQEDLKIYDFIRRNYIAQDTPLDVTIIRNYFEVTDQVDCVNRLEEIKRVLPYIRTNYESICRSVKDQQEIRSFILACRDASSIAEHGRNINKKIIRGVPDATAFLQTALSKLQTRFVNEVSIEQAIEKSKLLAMAPRLETGFESLDSQMGGGLPSPRLVIIGGAPSAGKTSLCVYWAHKWMIAGHPIMFLAIDEGAEGIGTRIERLGTQFHMPGVIIEDGTIEQASARLQSISKLSKFEGKTPVLVVDSIQTAMATGSANCESAKARVDLVVSALKRASVSNKQLVVATSELNRSSYANKKQDEGYHDIAGGKESGRIEYAAQTLLVLKAVQDPIHVGRCSETLVDVSVPKNRGFKRQPFRLELARGTMSYQEVARPDTAFESQEQESQDIQRLIDVIRNRTPKNRDDIQAVLRWGNDKLSKLITKLKADGIIEHYKSGWRLVSKEDLLT